jgi:hypothetical protein
MVKRGPKIDGILECSAAPLVTLRADAPAARVETVPAHVPFAESARFARDGIGPADNGDDEVAGLQAALMRRFDHASKAFVTEDEPCVSVRREPIRPRENFVVRAADPDGKCLDKDCSLAHGRFRHVVEP